MESKEIRPLNRALAAKVKVPGSKSITQRALICAALADGTSTLKGALQSEDPTLLIQALEKAGVQITVEEDAFVVKGVGGRPILQGAKVYLGNNGTGTRFFTAFSSLGSGKPLILTGTKRLCERPIEPLVRALTTWGAKIRYLGQEGFLPLEIAGGGLVGGGVRLDVAKSSQFLSALLLVGPYTQIPAEIHLTSPLVSRPYIDLTIAVMKDFGVVVQEREGIFFVPKDTYTPREYYIEGDASSASYFLAAAALVGGSVTVTNLPQQSKQGDAAFAGILSRMGCVVSYTNGVTVSRNPSVPLKGIDINMGRTPDLVPTLAVVAAKARGRTFIRGVPHLRYKETDRLKAVATELAQMGVSVTELQDGFIIEGQPELKATEVETYDDHRIAMAFAVLGLVVPGLRLRNPDCVKKSFPHFWEVFETLYA